MAARLRAAVRGRREELAECVEHADAPFAGAEQAGADEREAGQAFEGAPAPAGTALPGLGRADVASGPLCMHASLSHGLKLRLKLRDHIDGLRPSCRCHLFQAQPGVMLRVAMRQ